MSTVDLSEVIDLLEMTLDKAEDLNGVEVPQAQHGKSRAQEMAEIQKNLLLLAHLCDKTRVLALDQYHAVRGFTAHLTPGEKA